MNGKLHHYTADTPDRIRVHIFLFIISTGLALGLAILFNQFGIQPYWWIESPSIFGFYGILFYFFNNYLWRVNYIRRIFFIETPDLNGRYKGPLSSSYDDFQTSKTANYEIHQKWNKILIFSETSTSTSKSLAAAFWLSEVNKKSIVFNYQNTPKADSAQTMNIHNGFADFYFDSSGTITGEFFNGRGRGTFGKVKLIKQ